MFNDTTFDSTHVISSCINFHVEVKEAYVKQPPIASPALIEHWFPPPTDAFKLNIDASISPDGQIGCEAVIRDWMGRIRITLLY